MKKFVIKVTLETADYERAKAHYTDAEIKSIMEAGATGELDQLLSGHEDMDEREPDPEQDEAYSRATAWEDEPRREE